jgi:type IV pilus assembly protein PilC
MDYTFIAYTGENRIINGSIAAATERAANERLTKLGYRVMSLKAVTPLNLDLGKYFKSKNQVKNEEIVTFTRQMATLLNAGVNIITSLELIASQTSNLMLKSVLTKVISDIRSGQKLSDAMSSHPAVFSSLYCRSLAVGEQSGDMSRTLNQIADYQEKGVKARKNVKSALSYPAFMAVACIAVVFVLLTFVFPTFIGLYKTMGVKLPALTTILMSVVDVLKIAGPILIGLMVVAAIGIKIYIRKPEGRYKWDRVLLKIPLLGPIMLLQELAISCRTMSLLFHSGLPLAEIIDVLIDSSGNQVVTKAWTDVKTSVFKGEGLSGPMAKNPVFLPMMVEMVKVGEETGEMDTTLMAVAQNYDADADAKTKAFVAVIQPTMTIVIGGVVFVIVLSMMSLMYSIYGQIKV